MDILVQIILIPIFLYVLFHLYQKWARPTGFPPGPPTLPFVGSLPWVGMEPPLRFKNWRQKYGDIIGLKIGPINAVVFNNIDHIRESFREDVFVGTIIPELETVMTLASRGPDTGLITSEGKTWIEQRRFLIKHLTELGVGKSSMEAYVHQDINDLVDTLKSRLGQPLDPYYLIVGSTLNCLWHIVAGERFELGDPKFQEIMKKLSDSLHVASEGFVIVLPYWLAKLFPNVSGFNASKRAFDAGFGLMEELINEHKKTYQEDNLRDYMDVYLHEIYSTTDPNSSFYKEKGEANMSLSTLSIFLAGVDATSEVLTWALYFLTNDLEAQTKLQKEIDSVVGSRLPSLNDRQNMPYTEAVLLEVFRMSSFAPLGGPHGTSDEANFHGYKIPKRTLIIPNLYGHHYDETIWGDPKNFRPTRFLSDDGKEIKKGSHSLVIPFSIGKRSCPGEPLGRNNAFLFMVSVFQRFSVTRDPNTPVPKETVRFIRIHPAMKYIFKDRV